MGDVQLYPNISTGMLAFLHFIQTLITIGIIGTVNKQKSSKVFSYLNDFVGFNIAKCCLNK